MVKFSFSIKEEIKSYYIKMLYVFIVELISLFRMCIGLLSIG